MRDILSRNVRDLDLDLKNGPRPNVSMPVERPYEPFYLFAIAVFALFVAVCEIITHELPNVLDSNL